MQRDLISGLIVEKLTSLGVEKLASHYLGSGPINHLVIDDLLPAELATHLCESFPPESRLRLLDARQEKKFVGVRFENGEKIVEECIYAFQQAPVLDLFAKICSIDQLEGDPELYAGGVSSMSNTCFLNPHIDNSHDRLKKRFRRLNLLYYVSKGWRSDEGGQLLLYPSGLQFEPIEIDCRFNRLVVMRTDNRSLHAVKAVSSVENRRKAISNYYFTSSSPLGRDYYHSTSFRGFPGETRKDFLLRIDALIRTSIKSMTGSLIGRYIHTGYHRRDGKADFRG